MAKQNCREWTLIVAMFKISESDLRATTRFEESTNLAN